MRYNVSFYENYIEFEKSVPLLGFLRELGFSFTEHRLNNSIVGYFLNKEMPKVDLNTMTDLNDFITKVKCPVMIYGDIIHLHSGSIE